MDAVDKLPQAIPDRLRRRGGDQMDDVNIYKPFVPQNCSHRFEMMEGDKVICYMTISGVTRSSISDNGSSYEAFYQVLNLFKADVEGNQCG